MTRLLLLVAALLVLSGCGGKKGLKAAEADPAAAVAQLRARELPRALKAGFVVKVDGPELQGTTAGAMVLARPDQFNINIQTPLRTPLVYLASDGRVMHAFVAQDSTFFRGDDALAVLAELTGGAVGVADVLQVLTGGLPMPDADVSDVRVEGDALQLTLAAPAGAVVEAAVDPRTALVRDLVVKKDDAVLVEVEVARAMRVGKQWMPEELELVLPTVGWTATLTFHSWDELGVVPDVFVLEKPAGAAEKDLVEALKGVAAEQGATVP